MRPLETELKQASNQLSSARQRVQQLNQELEDLNQEVEALKTKFAQTTGEAESLKIQLQKAEDMLAGERELATCESSQVC